MPSQYPWSPPKHLSPYLPALVERWKVKFTTTVGFLRGLSTNRVSWVGPRAGQAALDQNLEMQKWELGRFWEAGDTSQEHKRKNIWGTPSKETEQQRAWWHTPVASALERQRQDLCDFKASMVYKASSTTTQRLRALTALPADRGSNPSTTRQFTSLFPSPAPLH